MSPDTPLNEAAIEDLEQEGEYLTTSEGSGEAEGRALLITDHSVLNGDDLQKAISTLDGYDIDIQTTQDEVTKVRSLESVAKLVLAQESIAQSDAEEIERVVGGLYENVAGRKEFTELPTRAHLLKVKEYVGEKVNEAKGSLIARHRKLTVSTFDSALCLCTALNDSLLPEIISYLEQLRSMALSDLEVASKTKRLLYYAKRGNDSIQKLNLADLRQIIIRPMTFQESYVNADPELPNEKALSGFYQAASNASLRKLISLSQMVYIDLPTSLKDSAAGRVSDGNVTGFSYLSLLGFLAQGELLTFFDNARIGLESVMAQATSTYENFKSLSDEAMTPDLIKDQLTEIGCFYSVILELEKYRNIAQDFAVQSEPILTAYSKVIRKD